MVYSFYKVEILYEVLFFNILRQIIGKKEYFMFSDVFLIWVFNNRKNVYVQQIGEEFRVEIDGRSFVLQQLRDLK